MCFTRVRRYAKKLFLNTRREMFTPELVAAEFAEMQKTEQKHTPADGLLILDDELEQSLQQASALLKR